MENKQKNKLGLGILIGILIGLVLGLGAFIIYDKVIDKDKKENVVDNKKNDGIDKDQSKGDDVVTDFDLNKVNFSKPAINGKSGDIYELTDGNIDYMSVELSSDNKVIISIDFSLYGQYFSDFEFENSIRKYEVSNFTKKVQKAYILPYGSSGEYIVALYLMEDGTVEYTLIYDQLRNDPTVTSMKSSGKVSNVSNICDIVAVVKSNTNEPLSLYGGSYVLAIKKDGTFYELSL